MSIRRELEKRPISYQQGTIVTSVQLSPRVKRLTIRPEEPFDWIPGQFIITKTHVDGEDVIADYTIISSVQNIETWDILVDNYPGSRVGQRMHDAKIGDEFTFKAPRGRFYLEADTDPDGIVFVFRDIGIAAAIPLLRELYELQSSAKIDIFNVMTSGFKSILEDEIDQFGQVLDIKYHPIIDELVDIDVEKMSVGKLGKKEAEGMFGHLNKGTFYLSGASIFNKGIRQKLISIGVHKEKLFREMFG